MSSNNMNLEPLLEKNDFANSQRRKRRIRKRRRPQYAIDPQAKKVSSNVDNVVDGNITPNKPAPAYVSTFTPVPSDKNKYELMTVKSRVLDAEKGKSVPALHNTFKVKPKNHENTQNAGQVYTVPNPQIHSNYTPIPPPQTPMRLVTLAKPLENKTASYSKIKSTEDAIYVPDEEDPKLSRNFTAYMDKMTTWPWKHYVKEVVTISGIEDDAALTKANYKFLKSTFQRNNSRSYWYKITIVGYPSNSTMETVLDSMLQYVYPERFIPCFVQTECRFLVTNCRAALLNICHQGLSFTSETGTKLYLTISLSSEAPDLDFFLVAHKHIRDRFNGSTGLLNLCNYAVIAYKGKVIQYFPLNYPANQKIMAEKLENFKKRPVKHLKLCNNNLRNIKDFNIPASYPHVQILDLRNNMLTSTTSLACLKGICARHVVLEGNPLCYDFVSQESYLGVLKYVFPKLLSVDGVPVMRNGLPVFQSNYLVDHDAHALVDAFLQTYFKLFDSEERRMSENIANLYHKNAVLTLCSSSLVVNLEGKLGMMIRHSKIVREKHRISGVFCGLGEIVKFFNRCPETQHDPQSFKVDVTMHTEKITIVTVSGIFKSPNPGLNDDEPLIYFTRTFVLKPISRYEYKVTNDMLYMTKPDKEVSAAAFSVTSPQCALSLNFSTSTPNPELKNLLTEVFMKLTLLSRQQASRCLEVRNWNVRLGLEYFILLKNRNEIHVLGGGDS